MVSHGVLPRALIECRIDELRKLPERRPFQHPLGQRQPLCVWGDENGYVVQSKTKEAKTNLDPTRSHTFATPDHSVHHCAVVNTSMMVANVMYSELLPSNSFLH